MCRTAAHSAGSKKLVNITKKPAIMRKKRGKVSNRIKVKKKTGRSERKQEMKKIRLKRNKRERETKLTKDT